VDRNAGAGGRGGGGFQGRGGGRGGGYQGGQGGWGGGRQDFAMQRLQEIQGPTHELPPIDTSERQFSGRSRLYIGNIGPGVTEESLKTDLGKYGEVGEMFYNSEKHFAFLRMDYRENAEKAKREMDGKMVSGRPMKVRFAPHQGALKVKNLGPWVSNELLHRAFSCFGDLERAFVMVDDRGRSKGEGVVEYERKPSALDALRRCSEGAFFLTASLRPVIVELVEEADDEDGLMDKALPKRNQEFGMEREMSCWHLVEQSWPFPSRLKQKFSACEIFPEPALLSFRRLLESPVCYTQVMPLCSINIKLMRLSQNILIEFLTNQCSHLCVSTKICARTNFIFICHCRLVPAFKTGDQAEDFR